MKINKQGKIICSGPQMALLLGHIDKTQDFSHLQDFVGPLSDVCTFALGAKLGRASLNEWYLHNVQPNSVMMNHAIMLLRSADFLRQSNENKAAADHLCKTVLPRLKKG